MSDSLHTIEEAGDLVLHLEDAGLGLDEKYRVSIECLRKNSQYFDSMLDPEKFAEGIAIKNRLEELSTNYGPSTTLPFDELPTLAMLEILEINHRVTSTITLLELFLFVLHGKTPKWPFHPSESMQSLAQLMLMADRFSAIEVTKRYVYDKHITTSGYVHPLASARRKDLQLRCKLLAGLYLGEVEWIRHGSAKLIVEGSHQWSLGSRFKENEETTPAWFHLPGGFEGQSARFSSRLFRPLIQCSEELIARRQALLDTISSIQKHFVSLYSSKELQCKKGYSNSQECDSFHLGEMVKFFLRKGTLEIQNIYADHDGREYEGDITELIAQLKECPTYQVDNNHSHCGVRQRMAPLLYWLMLKEHVGICLRCWNYDRLEESWLEKPTGGKWTNPTEDPKRRSKCEEHKATKAMYTAAERNWTPPVQH